MGLKKYEIITVGSDKRVRALRSWAVGGRYVNIGDVGGIVYDEKTLSQDGACWLFRGNFGFPGARIGGDSIVDVGEAVLPVKGSPAVDILGSSVVVGSKIQFESRQTAADAVVLTAADFEQGTFASYVKGQKLQTADSAKYIRTKNPIFLGGKSLIVKCGIPGFIVTGIVTDADGYISENERTVTTKEDGALALPTGQYFSIVITKNPAAATVPGDATAAQITFTGTYETKLSIIDSRLEVNPATSTGTLTLRPGGFYTIVSGEKYPEAIIRNSKVSIIAPGSRMLGFLGQIIGSTATLDTTASEVVIAGSYNNIKNLTASGVLSSTLAISAYDIIQAHDCDNFVVSPTIFPGLADAQTAKVPFIFRGCNVPDGRFYHHVQIANTYKNIDFAKARADLGKTLVGNREFASSEVEGLYRLVTPASGLVGCLVESFASVEKLTFDNFATAYGTIIYKDAYLNGLFAITGTNVFGNTKKHDTQDVSGCKIVNTRATAVNMKGNIRVEGNATLTNCSIIGSGYFGGKCVVSGMVVNGCAYMKDNASIIKTAGSDPVRDLRMTENAYAVLGDFALNGRIHLSDNAKFTPTAAGLSEGDLVMKDNAVISGAVTVGGILTMKDNAKVSAGTLTTYGDITVCGSFNQTVSKSWTGKRVIDSVNAPEYDNNVKTQYDF